MGRRRQQHQEEPENLERWLVSYADFVTLLFAFFVVMYAVSSVNEGKYRVLSETLNAVFTVSPRSDEPIQVGEDPKDIFALPDGPIAQGQEMANAVGEAEATAGSAQEDDPVERFREDGGTTRIADERSTDITEQ